MRLEDKINSIPANQITTELTPLVDSLTCGRTWLGSRVVWHKDYEGTASIDLLFRKCWQSFREIVNRSSPLQIRWDCYTLWQRVENLYGKSNESLRWSLKFLPAILRDIVTLEFIKGNFPIEDTLFEFSREEYQRIWPEKDVGSSEDRYFEMYRYYVSSQAVEIALNGPSESVISINGQ